MLWKEWFVVYESENAISLTDWKDGSRHEKLVSDAINV